MAELCIPVDVFLSCFFSNSSNTAADTARFCFFSNVSNTAADTASEYEICGHRRCWTAASCPYNSDSSGLVPLLLLPTPRQAGKACSTSCVLFSYWCKNSFDQTAESFACAFFTYYVIFGTSSNRLRSRKPYGTPLEKRRSIVRMSYIIHTPPSYIRNFSNTYLGSGLIPGTYVLIPGTYVCGTQNVPHTKTKIIRTHAHTHTRANFFWGM